eukprot:comp39472_c0_seq1/m.47378 comp39472_c0_seq1/g.47378  ORF comp39472_c0_seq1/g.47378 comp39472_c0_seq1/m.47378 type:complete len:194 (-) comp39472_c0_seq1:165-746(-)
MVEVVKGEADRLRALLEENKKTVADLLKRAHSLKEKESQHRKELKETLQNILETPEEGAQDTQAANQKDNERIQQLTSENTGLYDLLDEYERGLGLIMRRHRLQIDTIQQQYSSEILVLRQANEEQRKLYERSVAENINLREKIKEMACVMAQAADEEEKRAERDERLLTSLAAENQVLRQLLEISDAQPPQN